MWLQPLRDAMTSTPLPFSFAKCFYLAQSATRIRLASCITVGITYSRAFSTAFSSISSFTFRTYLPSYTSSVDLSQFLNMGQSISVAVKAIAVGDIEAEKQKSREDLGMLQKMVDSKLDAFQYELNEYKLIIPLWRHLLTIDAQEVLEPRKHCENTNSWHSSTQI
jgi:hypothetical protein